MKRTIATLGVVGLGIMGATVAAYAAPPSSDENSIIICHAKGGSGSYTAVEVSVNGLSGHSGHADDVVPQNNGTTLPGGQNLTTANLALLAQGCVAGGVVPTTPPPPPPTDEPTPTDSPTPSDTPSATPTPSDTSSATPTTPAVVTVVVPPATTPAAVTPAPAAVTPVASTPVGAAAASVPAASNTGYNVQTAVGSPGGIPAWLSILTGLFAAAGAWVLVKSGLRSRGAGS